MIHLKQNICNTLLIAAIIALMFLFVCLPSNVDAQIAPEPAPECWWEDGVWVCISHVEKPYIVYAPLIQR